MSRSIQTIFNSIITEKETFSSLSGLEPPVIPDPSQDLLTELTSTSKVSIWQLKFWVQAVAIFIHESLFDVFKSDVEKRALDIIPATTRFYVLESLKFQLGFELVFTDGTFKFADSTSAAALDKQIVKQASARDINEVVTIKVATRTTPTSPLSPLVTNDKTAFINYINKIKIAGIKTIIISDVPDLLKVAYTIEFDPLVMKSDGTLIEDGASPVQLAIDAYIEGLDFDFTFKVMELTDSIQLARGVVNAVADVIEARFGALSFTDILAVPTEIYLPNAGYLVTVDETGSAGSINVLALPPPEGVSIIDYDSAKSPAYQIGDFVIFQGKAFKANAVSADPAGVFDPTKWDTVSNLTFIST